MSAEIPQDAPVIESADHWQHIKHASLRVVAPLAAVAALTATAVVHEIHTIEHRADDRVAAANATRDAAFSETSRIEARDAAQTARIHKILSVLPGAAASDALGVGLIQPSDLMQEHKQVLSPEIKKEHLSSTVEIGRRPKGETGLWEAWCSATKVKDHGKEYVLTASHCFEDNLPPKGGGIFPSAENFTSQLKYDYVILDPTVDTAERENGFIAAVTGVAVDFSGYSDWSLLSVQANTTSKLIDYDSIPAIDLQRTLLQDRDADEEVGKPVSLYGLPQQNNYQGVAATGVYLGRADNPMGEIYSLRYDIVGVNFNPDTPSHDPCEFGSSGSSAAFNDGRFFGPLSSRFNEGYGPGFVGADQQVALNSPAQNMANLLALEKVMGVDLSSFDTVCQFTVSDPTHLGQLETVLADPSQVFYEDK